MSLYQEFKRKLNIIIQTRRDVDVKYRRLMDDLDSYIEEMKAHVEEQRILENIKADNEQ